MPLQRKSSVEKQLVNTRRFDIPYFADNQLDPKYFPADIGSAVGGPPEASLLQTMVGADADWEDTEYQIGDTGFDDQVIPGTASTKTTKRRRSSGKKSPTPDTKRLKIAGGRPALAKKVTADLDSDDELIVRMKQARYQEREIAQRLRDEGRINYNSKTIGTRWTRICLALQKRQDEMLDAELTDWHEGDDEVLERAITVADEHVRKAVEAVQASKWRIVADTMKNIKPVVNFSQNACRSRYESLASGTAKPTPESIPDPDAHTMQRIQSRLVKEAKIAEDSTKGIFGNIESDNLKGNSWTSRQKRYI